MIKIKGFEKSMWAGWSAPGVQSICTTVISRIFGALDPKATYEARFYGKRPKTEAVELQIRKIPVTIWLLSSSSHFAIRKGKGLWHDITYSANLREIWDIAKHDGADGGYKVRKFYVRLVETAKRT